MLWKIFEQKGVKLYLKRITLIVIISIICAFFIRTIGTVFPQIFKNIFIVKISLLVNIIFILSYFIFWLIFYKEYASTKTDVVKITCLLTIISSLAVLFLYLKKLPLVFNLNINFPLFLINPYIDALVPLISSIFHLIFFVAFRNSLQYEEERILNKPILSMIAGISLFLFFHLVVLVNFITTNKFEWLEHMPRVIAVGTIPLLIIAVFLILIFYFRFYYFLDSGCKIKKE